MNSHPLIPVSLSALGLLAVLAATGGAAAQPAAQETPAGPEVGTAVSETRPGDDTVATPSPAAEDADQSGPVTPALERAVYDLEAAESRHGADSDELVAPLNALARAYLEVKEFAAAEKTLLRLVGLLEKQHGVYDQRIAEPLATLASVYSAWDRHEDAILALQRAQHLTHRADGVYSLQQLDYIGGIADNFLAMRQYAEADRHNRVSFMLSEKNFGPDSPQLVPAMMKLGDWYRRVGNVREARQLFERAIDVLERAYGPEDPALVEPLLALGKTTFKRAQYRKQREKALQRMVNIVAAQPEVDVADKAASWAHLGDFYIMVDDHRSAAEAYGEGWTILQQEAALGDGARALFADPVVLHFPRRIYLMDRTPGAPIGGYDDTLQEFDMEVEFEVTVGADGRVLEVEAVSLDANSTTRRQLRRYVREARFRPRIVNGEPVRADNFRLTEKITIIRPRI